MIDLSGFNADLFDGTFDEEGVFTPSGGSSRNIPVIFDNEYQGAKYPEGDIQIESSGPKATCLEPDVAGAAHGDTLVIRGKAWHVLEVRPNGMGLVTLLLSQDPIP